MLGTKAKIDAIKELCNRYLNKAPNEFDEWYNGFATGQQNVALAVIKILEGDSKVDNVN